MHTRSGSTSESRRPQYGKLIYAKYTVAPLYCSFLEAKQISVSEKSVEARISLASLAHEAGQSDDVFLSSHFSWFVDLLTRSNMVKNLFVAFTFHLNSAENWISKGLKGDLPQRSRSGPKRGPWRWWACWWRSTFLGCRYPQCFLRRLASLIVIENY